MIRILADHSANEVHFIAWVRHVHLRYGLRIPRGKLEPILELAAAGRALCCRAGNSATLRDWRYRSLLFRHCDGGIAAARFVITDKE